MIQVADGAMTATYAYNGNGQRVKKTVNGVTTVFHYSLNGQIIAESNNAGTITAEYVYLNGQPLAKMEGANTYYYHNDHLATPQKMTDASGQVVWSADYKPFGEATITVSTITNNLRFPGQYYDAETGLHYNYFRDYNPGTGNYNETDPIGLKAGLNLYRYTDNNPLKRTDRYGLDWYYSQGTGRLVYFNASTQMYIDFGENTGLSGNNQGLNNSAMQNVKGVGPIVTGTYTMGDMVKKYYSKEYDVTLYDVIPLNPDAATEKKIKSLKRTGGFLIHFAKNNRTGGCVGMRDNMRKMISDIIAQTGDRTFHVEEVLLEDFADIMNLQP